MKRQKIFLCHSSKDKSFVKKLATDLKTVGLDVWYDAWEIKVGDSLRQKIEDGITESSWLAVILSSNSIQSDWVNRELSAAFAYEMDLKRVFILPVIIENCPIPPLLRDKLYADFRENYQFGFNAILKATGNLGPDEENFIAINNNFKNYLDLPAFWWGKWEIPKLGRYADGNLFISDVS